MNVVNFVRNNVEEIEAIANNLDESQLEEAVSLIINAQRVFFSGMGRSGDMARALCIRCMHLGYEAYTAGEPATPSIGKGDLLIGITSSGTTKNVLNHIETAHSCGASVLVITSKQIASANVDAVIVIPAKTIVSSNQHAGSLFEQSSLVIGDAILATVIQEKKISTEFMNQRHANLQ